MSALSVTAVASMDAEQESSVAFFGWLVRLRWIAVLGIALVLGLSGPVFGMLPPASTRGLVATLLALAAYNAAAAAVGPRRGWSWFNGAASQIVVDCAALATLVHFAGGIENPFLPLFVLHVVTANIVLSERAGAAVTGFVLTLVAAVVVGEASGVLAYHCIGSGTGRDCSGGPLDLRAWAALLGLALALVGSSVFTRMLAARLRRGQGRLVATVAELESEKEELARSRSAVLAEQSRLQAIVDCMADAVTFLGAGGEVLFSNQRSRELWRSEFRKGGTEGAAAWDRMASASPSDAPVTFETGGRAFEASRSPVRGPSAEPLGVVIVARDITERRALERRLMHDEQMYVTGKLAATVAHEINNPLGVVTLYSQHALTTVAPDHPAYQHLRTIHRNAESCRRIISELLSLARPRRPERRRVDLRRLCREVIDSVQLLAAEAGVRVSSGTHARDVPIWTEADAGMLLQAVLNLAVNAIEATSNGTEVFVGAYEAQDRDVAGCVIEVRDTGVGMTADQLEQVFQPFFTTKATGTGLGLSIAENVVKSHQGRIEVQSVVGEGTIVRIVLPRVALTHVSPRA
ncbi:MAG: hypothetical protein IT360_18890 [Gemmatimonadaceae bacterium]|nr:hypothetical protein [Gemmatimonadaceae bacterium]